MKGLNKIILINSMRCARAEFKTKGNVLLTGRNNLGKSAALRLWVYLYTGDRNMLGLSRQQFFCEFYFPSEKNSYIIYEFFDDLGEYMFILSAKGHKIYTRIVDAPYKREYFFDDNKKAYDSWEKIAEKIGSKANELPEIIGEQNFRNLLYGNYGNNNKNPYKRFALVKSANSDGLRNCIQNVFLNDKKELVHTSDVKDFILQVLNMTETNIEITKLKALIKPVKAQWGDQQLWNMTDKTTGVKIKQKEAQEIVKTYHRLVEIEKNLILYMRMLNFIVPNNHILINKTNEALEVKKKELERILQNIEKLKNEYETESKSLNEKIGKFEGVLEQIEDERKYFGIKKNAEIIELCKNKDRIKTELERVKKELEVLNSQFKNIEDKCEKLIEAKIKPLRELLEKNNKDISQLKEKYLTKRNEVEKTYYEECQNIDKQHHDLISQIIERKDELQKEKEKNTDDANNIELYQPYGEEITKAEKKMTQYQSEKKNNEQALEKLEKQLDEKRNVCHAEIDKLITAKTTEWEIERKTLVKGINDLKDKLDNIEGSLLNFLEDNVPEWKDNIGKVIDDNVLYSQNTNPSLCNGDNSFFGVNINTEEIQHTPLTVNEIHRKIINGKEKLNTLSSFINNPRYALQKEIEEMELNFNKQNKTLADQIKGLNDNITRINGLIQKTQKELDRLAKLQDIARQKKLDELKERLNNINALLETEKQALEQENGTEGWEKRKKTAEDKYKILLKETENIKKEYEQLYDACSDINEQIDEETEKLNDLKNQELENEGSDINRIADLKRILKTLEEQNDTIDNNQKLFARYEMYLEKLATESSTKCELDALKNRLEKIKNEHNENNKKLESKKNFLHDDISQDAAYIKDWNDDIQMVNDFNESYLRNWPHTLLTSEIEETDKRAETIIKYLKENRKNRNSEMNNLVSAIDNFLKGFSDDNIYHFNKNLSVVDNKQYDQYRKFAENMEKCVRD